MTEKKLRIQKLLDTPLRVFYHTSFDDLRQRKNILSDIPELEKFQKDYEKVRRLRSGKIAPEMRPCYEAPLLIFEQEQHLFRKLNFYKHQAKKLLSAVDPARMGENRLA